VKLAKLPYKVAAAKLSIVGTPASGNWRETSRGSRQSRGYGAEWDRLRKQVLKRDQYLCQCETCKSAGRITPANEVDHIRAKALGGTNDLSNLRAINSACHKAKTARDRAEAMAGGYVGV
jgi:5-methylcytosine-specific restriction protein A